MKFTFTDRWSTSLRDAIASPYRSLLDRRDLELEAFLDVRYRDWTPAVDHGGAITATVVHARYLVRRDGSVTGDFLLGVTAASVAAGASAVRVSLPVPALTNANQRIGSATIYDGANRHVGSWIVAAAGSTSLIEAVVNGANVNTYGLTPAANLAIGDVIGGEFTYEAAP